MPKNGGGHVWMPGRLVIPGVLIIGGALILLNNLGIISEDLWSYARKLWPIVLILIGIDFLVDKLRR